VGLSRLGIWEQPEFRTGHISFTLLCASRERIRRDCQQIMRVCGMKRCQCGGQIGSRAAIGRNSSKNLGQHKKNSLLIGLGGPSGIHSRVTSCFGGVDRDLIHQNGRRPSTGPHRTPENSYTKAMTVAVFVSLPFRKYTNLFCVARG